MFETVLLAIDHSPETTETVAVGLQLAQQHGSRVVLLSVVEEEGTMHDPVAVTQLLEQARSRVEEAGLPCDVFERQGNEGFVLHNQNLAAPQDIEWRYGARPFRHLLAFGRSRAAGPSSENKREI